MKYQAKDCHSKCRAKFLNESCGCSPFVYNIDQEYRSCTPLENYRCLKEYVIGKNGEAERWPKCEECATECNKWVYGTSNSYGRGFSEAAILSLKMSNANWTDEYIKSNILSMNVFFRDLAYTEYAQVTATTVTQLLSNMGGTLGLFLGMSVLTVFESIIYAAKVFWMFVSCQRRSHTARKERKVKMEQNEKERTVNQIRTLSARNLENIALSMTLGDVANEKKDQFCFIRDTSWATLSERDTEETIHSNNSRRSSGVASFMSISLGCDREKDKY